MKRTKFQREAEKKKVQCKRAWQEVLEEAGKKEKRLLLEIGGVLMVGIECVQKKSLLGDTRRLALPRKNKGLDSVKDSFMRTA